MRDARRGRSDGAQFASVRSNHALDDPGSALPDWDALYCKHNVQEAGLESLVQSSTASQWAGGLYTSNFASAAKVRSDGPRRNICGNQSMTALGPDRRCAGPICGQNSATPQGGFEPRMCENSIGPGLTRILFPRFRAWKTPSQNRQCISAFREHLPTKISKRRVFTQPQPLVTKVLQRSQGPLLYQLAKSLTLFWDSQGCHFLTHCPETGGGQIWGGLWHSEMTLAART